MASSPERRGAWKSTRTRTRRLQVWFKQSISSLSHPETVFEEEDQETHQHQHHDAEEPQEQHDDESLVVAPLCRNIDQAMESLHGLEIQHDAQDFQAYACRHEHDWILDGHDSWAAEQEYSAQLMEELRGPSLDEFFEREILKRQAEQDLDESQAAVTDDSDEDEFGEFQMATIDVESTTAAHDDAESTASDVHPATPVRYVKSNDHSEESEGRHGGSNEAKRLDIMVAEDPSESSSLTESVATFHSPLHVERALHYHEKKTVVYDSSLGLTDDVTSPEGRFARREHLGFQEDYDETDLDLAEHYFSDPRWNETLDVLRAMPWDSVSILNPNNHVQDPFAVDEHVTQRLSQLDASHAKVNRQLVKKASTRTHALAKANNVIHELDHNLAMAEMYADRSKESLEWATGTEAEFTGVAGATTLLLDFDKRDQYASLEGQLSKIAKLLEQEQELKDCIASFGTDGSTMDHLTILERAKRLHVAAHEDEDLSRLVCLDELRKRSFAALGVFRDQIESVLCSFVARMCGSQKSCSDGVYERLFQSMHDVHDRLLETTNGEPPADVSERWSKCVVDTLCYQADMCFARALLDPTDSAESDYDQELLQLCFELKQDSGDTAKLLSLTHNLVTIRFDFEADRNYLPMVYHRLCALLTNVLHGHFLLTNMHKELPLYNGEAKGDASECQDRITQSFRSAKVDLWQRCEQVLVKCLDQYHFYSGKKKLFDREKNDGGLAWMEDLDSLHDVLRLTQQFLSLGVEFLDENQLESARVTSLTVVGDQDSISELSEKLCEVFHRHLRSVHVEAMTSMGASLFKESWRLTPLDGSESSRATGVRSVKERLLRAIEANKQPSSHRKWYWQNGFCSSADSKSCFLQSKKAKGNPFLSKSPRKGSKSESTLRRPLELRNGRHCTEPTVAEQDHDLFSSIHSLFDDGVAVLLTTATESACKGLVMWTARLLLVLEKLPLVADGVTNVFRDLYDLYFVTAFRLCAGNAKNEKILLGIESATPLFSPDSENDIGSPRSILRKEPSGFMGFGRRPNQTRMRHRRRSSYTPTDSRNADADICAPLPSESRAVTCLREFVISGQANLGTCVKLDRIDKQLKDPNPLPEIDADFVDTLVQILKKRQGAAWSCLFVAALLEVSQMCAEKTLTASFLSRPSLASKEDDACSSLDSLASYCKSVSRSAPFLVQLSSRIACVRAIMGGQIVKQIVAVGPTWEESKLNEQSSHYVDLICDRYALMWRSLALNTPALPPAVLRATWENIVEGGFLSLLEGFARVPYCSTEGRSLMSMDLASFSVGIDPASLIDRLEMDEPIRPPLPVTPKRGMRYVDMYIRVFYYPEEDVMKWIVANYTDYQLNHSMSLLTSGASDRVEYESPNIQKMIGSVQALYTNNATCNGKGSLNGRSNARERQ